MNATNANTEESFFLLSELHKSPHLTQRELSAKLNISLGKTNYLLRQLIKKGIIKVKSFSYNPGKLGKVKYILTGKGLEQKVKFTYHFLKKKVKSGGLTPFSSNYKRRANKCKIITESPCKKCINKI